MNQVSKDAMTYLAMVLYFFPMALYVYAFKVAHRTWVAKGRRIIVFLALFFSISVVLLALIMAITTDVANKQEISPRIAFMENAKLFVVLEGIFASRSCVWWTQFKAQRQRMPLEFYGKKFSDYSIKPKNVVSIKY